MVAMAAALICMLFLACAPFAQAAAADAKCTGTPTACDARLNKCARGCEQKSALVTSGAGAPGAFACSGTPTACEAMESRDACTLQGCQWEDDEGVHLCTALCLCVCQCVDAFGTVCRVRRGTLVFHLLREHFGACSCARR